MAKKNQWGNQNPYIEEELTKQWPKETNGLNLNPYIEEELTTQWPKDTKGVNPNPYNEEELTTQWSKYTKGVIRILISKKSRRHNGQKIPKG